MMLPNDLTDDQFDYLMKNLSRKYPKDGKSFCGVLQATVGVDNAKELLKRQENEGIRKKIALFCGLYKQEFGVNYKVSKKDSLMASKVEFKPELLKIFFRENYWWNKDRKTIENYTKNINTLQLIEAGVQQDTSLPNKYSPDYEKALQGDKLVEYWQHLRKLEWKPRKLNGRVVGWERGENEYVSKY